MGVGRLQFVVQAPGDGQARTQWISRGRIGKRTWRSGSDEAGDVVQPREARGFIYVLDAGGIFLCGRQSVRPLPIEGVDDALAEVVEVQAVSGSNGGLPIVRRVGNGQARRQIAIVPVPNRFSVVGLARENKRDVGLGNEALRLIPSPLIKPIVQAEVWCHLVSAGLIRRLEQGIAEAKSDREIGTDS